MQSRPRTEHIQEATSKTFDLLIIGGGATGCGIALDAASRGLTTLLIEKEDFAAATSSRSTKLAHGGVRYLEQAAWHLDRAQLSLVHEALHERAHFFENASFLTHRLPILTPIYRWWELPYYWAGLKAYDWIARNGSLGPSRFLSRSRALQRFPNLRKEGLCGAVIYQDGQFNDARMALLLALTAEQKGSVLLNHCEVEQIEPGGVVATDRLTGEKLALRAKRVVNATGPFADSIRKMDDSAASPLLQPSAGTHLLLPAHYCPTSTGMLIPNTKDNRILFVLPWEGLTLAGTTDHPAKVEPHPTPTSDEVDFILEHLGHYFNRKIGRDEVKSAWSGLRPLVQSGTTTSRASRDHTIEISKSGMISIIGGKWTTYRRMAEEVVDLLEPPCKSRTDEIPLLGSEGYTKNLSIELQNEYHLNRKVANHLARSYGARARGVLQHADGFQRLAPPYPYLEAEITFAAKFEQAQTAIDILARRTRLAFLDQQAAREALPVVIQRLQLVHGWSDERCEEERQAAIAYLDVMR